MKLETRFTNDGIRNHFELPCKDINFKNWDFNPLSETLRDLCGTLRYSSFIKFH